jgi:hypothetical protein
MKGILCTLSLLIIIGWGIGYFEYHIEGGFFHLILVIALTVMVIQLIPSRKL